MTETVTEKTTVPIARAQDELNKLVQLFQTKEIPGLLAKCVINSPEKPSARWSFGNQLLMLFHGTTDARGFRQWQQVNRYVKKGSHAFYILGPIVRQKEIEDEITHSSQGRIQSRRRSHNSPVPSCVGSMEGTATGFSSTNVEMLSFSYGACASDHLFPRRRAPLLAVSPKLSTKAQPTSRQLSGRCPVTLTSCESSSLTIIRSFLSAASSSTIGSLE